MRAAAPALAALALAAGCAGEPRAPAAWQRVLPQFEAPIYDLLRDPADPEVVYAACGRQPVSPMQQVGGVLRSVDGGRRWVEASRGIPRGTEVLALAFAPEGFGELGGALVAATYKAGLYASLDGGSSWRRLGAGEGAPDWSRMVLQAALGVPGETPALVVGSRGQGVLVSIDGGASWLERNDGLLNLTIEALQLAGGELYVATRYGGVYTSRDLGASWRSAAAGLERVALSSFAVDARGTLWVGLQSSGLLACPTGGEPRQVGPAAEAGVGVPSLATVGERIAVGTDSRGVLLGSVDGLLSRVDTGLDNQAVLAISLDPRSLQGIVVGTWGGLYRSLPPPSRALPATLVAIVAVVITAALAYGRLRSVPAQAGRLFHALDEAAAEERLGLLFASRAMRSQPERAQALFEHLARRLERADSEHRTELAGVVWASAELAAALATSTGDRGRRQRLVTALVDRAHALSGLAGGGLAGDVLATRDRAFAELLGARELGALAPLERRLRGLVEASEASGGGPLVDPMLWRRLARVLSIVEPLHRLPSAEDRVLFLGQALEQTLAIQVYLGERAADRGGCERALAVAAVDSLRELLAGALRGMRQRAELVVELRSRELRAEHRAVVVVEVRNVGRGPALNLEVELLSSDGLRVPEPRASCPSLLRSQTVRFEMKVEPRAVEHQGHLRLRFRVTYDDLDRRGRVLELTDVARLHRSSPTDTFVPLHPNPFVVGRPLTPEDVFIGRAELFERIAASFGSTHQDNVVVLIGQRRMGKTSVLRRLPRVLGATHLPVLVDLQGLLGSGEAAFLHELAVVVRDELEAAGLELREPARADFDREPGPAFRQGFLRPAVEALGGRRLLLLFDELEVLEERIRAGELPARILPFLRSLMQHEERVSFVLAGTHRLDELTRDYWSVLFNLAVYLEIGPLSPSEVVELFTTATRGHFDVDPLALEKLYQVSGGHPHFTQLVARELVTYGNRRRLSHLALQDVQRITATVAEQSHLHIAYLWEEASRDQRLLLLVLKELLDDEGVATLAAAHRALGERRIEPGDLPTALRALLRKEILVDNGGMLSFRMELLRQWMGRHRSLEAFLLEPGESPGTQR